MYRKESKAQTDKRQKTATSMSICCKMASKSSDMEQQPSPSQFNQEGSELLPPVGTAGQLNTGSCSVAPAVGTDPVSSPGKRLRTYAEVCAAEPKKNSPPPTPRSPAGVCSSRRSDIQHRGSSPGELATKHRGRRPGVESSSAPGAIPVQASRKEKKLLCPISGCFVPCNYPKKHAFEFHIPRIFYEGLDLKVATQKRKAALKLATTWLIGTCATILDLAKYVDKMDLLAGQDREMTNTEIEAMRALCSALNLELPATFTLSPLNSPAALLHWRALILIISLLKPSQRQSFLELSPDTDVFEVVTVEQARKKSPGSDSHIHLGRTCRVLGVQPGQFTIEDLSLLAPATPGQEVELVGCVPIFCDLATNPTTTEIHRLMEQVVKVCIGIHQKEDVTDRDQAEFQKLLNCLEEHHVLGIHFQGMKGDSGNKAYCSLRQLNDLVKQQVEKRKAQAADQRDVLPETWPDYGIMNLPVKVISCDQHSHIVKDYWDNDLVYKMRKVNRGRCFIISNKYFSEESGSANRIGTEKDEDGLRNLFEQLNFDVIIYKDQTAEDMKCHLHEESQQEAHREAEAFVCILLSHGTTKGVCGVDGNTVSIDAITEMFDAHHCEGLRNKPKFFFVQACRGGNKDLGGNYGIPVEEENQDEKKLSRDETDAQREEYPTVTLNADLSTKADILAAYATSPGFVSFRDEKHGSLFIQAVIYIFMTFAHKEDAAGLLTMVTNVVSRGRTPCGQPGVNMMQCPPFTSFLRKKFYFFPGLVE